MPAPTPRSAHGPAAQRPRRQRSVLALWLGILGPPTVWLARLEASYVLVPYACASGRSLGLHAVTAAALALAAAAGWLAWRGWRGADAAPATDGPGPLARTRFLALLGLLSAAFFLAVIAAEGVFNFLIDPCLTSGRRIGF